MEEASGNVFNHVRILTWIYGLCHTNRYRLGFFSKERMMMVIVQHICIGELTDVFFCNCLERGKINQFFILFYFRFTYVLEIRPQVQQRHYFYKK